MDAARDDPLTGLPVFVPNTPAMLRQGAAVAFVDLDDFRRQVNEPYGHEAGDRVLATVAQRLASEFAPWRVFRSGGDEFTIEILGPLDHAGAERIADRVAAILAHPLEETGSGIAAHVGLSLRRIDGDQFTVFLEAEQAVFWAGHLGRPFFIAGDPA